ncbi:MAG TPA: hypothetical protein DIV39_10185 [Verrucomicrobiales bacterium]|nr:hypothetical protein [Verrucomicrobiales bacterium]
MLRISFKAIISGAIHTSPPLKSETISLKSTPRSPNSFKLNDPTYLLCRLGGANERSACRIKFSGPDPLEGPRYSGRGKS